MVNNYDYIVIGSGPAGHVSAIRAAQLGLKTAIIERSEEQVGGVCLNEGCIPAKSLYRSAMIFDIVKKNSEIYKGDKGHVQADIAGFVKKSRDASCQLRKGLIFLFKKNNIDIIKGSARFVNNKRVRVSPKSGEPFILRAEKFLIAAGSHPRALQGLAFDAKRVLTSSHAICLNKVPQKMLIIGAGAIGMEFASCFNLFGTEVFLIEAEPFVLSSEDREVSRYMEAFLKQKGVKVFTSSRVKDVSVLSQGLRVAVDGEKGGFVEDYEMVLAAVGRRPSTSNIGIELAGVDADDKGFIKVDHEMRTNVDNIYAAGDVLRTPMLAHAAFAEGRIAAEAAYGLKPKSIDYNALPNAVYAEVQAASVGLTEEKAKEKNIDAAIGKYFFKSCGKAVADARTEGFLKIIADKKNRKILGAHIVGYEAAELIHEFALAMSAGLTVDNIAETVHAHPTFSEIAASACESVFGKSIF